MAALTSVKALEEATKTSSSSSSTVTKVTTSLRASVEVEVSPVEAAFESFVHRFEKSYASEEERARRFEVFRTNFEHIMQHNAGNHSYELGINAFADLTTEEFNAMYGMSNVTLQDYAKALWGDVPLLEAERPQSLSIPDSLDWRAQGAVGKVEDQGQCGACWAFSAAAAIEGGWKIAGGPLRPLSPQQFTDCAGGDYGNSGCKGGLPQNAFVFAHYNDICTYASYRYVGHENGACLQSNCNVGVPKGGVRGAKLVPPHDEQALMAAVAQQPVAVAIEADSMAFQLYQTGIITSTSCFTKQINHGVTLVGYGTDGGVDYWLIKNSWGINWGESGYVRMKRGVPGPGECGILELASYPVINAAKVVPGSFDLDPGMTAAAAFAALVGCIFLCCCYSNLKGRCARARQPPLLASSGLSGTSLAAANTGVRNPWNSFSTRQLQAQQAVQAAPAPAAAAAAAPAAAASQVRTGNSSASRLVQQTQGRA